jgi:hypothetical protein
MRVAGIGFVLAAGLVGAANPVAAAPAPAWTLEWRAPASCPTATAMRARVAALLGGPVDAAGTLRVAGELRAHGDGWQLSLVAGRKGERSRRVLHGSDCAALGEAAAIIVALAIDPGLVATFDADAMALVREAKVVRDPPRPSSRPIADEPGDIVVPEPPPPVEPPSEVVIPAAPPEPPPVVTPSIAPAEPTAVAPSIAPAESPPPAPDEPAKVPQKAAMRPWAAIRVDGGVGLGPLPRVGGLLGLTVALGLGRYARIELAASRWLSTALRLPAAPAAGADFTLTTGGARGCGVPGRGRIEVPLCLGIELGGLRGRPVALADGRSAVSLWAAATLGAALVVVPVRRIALWLAVDGHLALARPRFLVDGAGEVWRPRLAGVRATLAIELRFSGP